MTALPKTDLLEAKDTKKSEVKANDSPSENRPSRGQGQECSRPRTKDTGASALQKEGLQNIFSGRSPRKRSSKNFFRRSTKLLLLKNTAVIEPRTGQFSRT